jgi:cytochrome P450
MGKVLDERRELKASGKSPEYIDAIEWFEQSANGRKYDPVNVQLTLSFVAIHTTSDLVTQVLFDLASHPEYIQPLRQEVIEVLGKYGWQKTSMYQLKLLDSVLKECQRLSPINNSKMSLAPSNKTAAFWRFYTNHISSTIAVLQRWTDKDVTLSDGTRVPRNTLLALAINRHWDEEFYPEPEKFDGYRFLQMRSKPGNENVAQFVSTSANHLGFGHGEHACPGRFFASNEVKIIMCHILLKYDWELIEGKHPKRMAYGWVLAADHSAPIRVRRRKEELDIDSL